jgi:hypothetical protein
MYLYPLKAGKLCKKKEIVLNRKGERLRSKGLKVPKCEIFDSWDFDDFCTIMSLCGATLGLK